jgi:hypothetical protein
MSKFNKHFKLSLHYKNFIFSFSDDELPLSSILDCLNNSRDVNLKCKKKCDEQKCEYLLFVYFLTKILVLIIRI